MKRMKNMTSIAELLFCSQNRQKLPFELTLKQVSDYNTTVIIYIFMNRMRLVFFKAHRKEVRFSDESGCGKFCFRAEKEQVESRKKDRCRMRAFVGCGAFASGSKVDILCLGQ